MTFSCYTYLKDPTAIYRQSFNMIREEADLSRFHASEMDMVIRIIHACGMTDIVDDLVLNEDVAQATRMAVHAGRPILTDCRMVAEAIIRRNLPVNARIECRIADPETIALAKSQEITRSAAQVALWGDSLAGAVVVIGNAPTCLFALLEQFQDKWAPVIRPELRKNKKLEPSFDFVKTGDALEHIQGGAPRPAAIFAFPVGFVGAAEAKQALIKADIKVPFVTLQGRRGGSAMAAAALNAVFVGANEQ